MNITGAEVELSLTNAVLQLAKQAGLKLSSDEVNVLVSGGILGLNSEKLLATVKCTGIAVGDLGNGCALYLNPFVIPPTIAICCTNEKE